MKTPFNPRPRGTTEAPSALGSGPGIFSRFAARSLKLNRTRTAVSIIGIALSCALITAIFTSVPESEIGDVHADPRVDRSYDRVSYGDALMPASFQGYWGRYLSVQEWPTADAVGGLKPLPNLSEGRAPQAPDEIVLAGDLKGMTVEKGQRLYDILPATGLDYTVPRVAPKDGRSYDQWGSMGPGYLGFVASPGLPARQTSIYLTTNLTSMADINSFIGEYTGADHAIGAWGNRGFIENMESQAAAYSHDSLLRYQGMTDDRSIWGTLYTLAAILSVVVIVASVSLIYNSFAIAVSERTRQFGLLSSLGASTPSPRSSRSSSSSPRSPSSTTPSRSPCPSARANSACSPPSAPASASCAARSTPRPSCWRPSASPPASPSASWAPSSCSTWRARASAC